MSRSMHIISGVCNRKLVENSIYISMSGMPTSADITQPKPRSNRSKKEMCATHMKSKFYLKCSNVHQLHEIGWKWVRASRRNANAITDSNTIKCFNWYTCRILLSIHIAIHIELPYLNVYLMSKMMCWFHVKAFNCFNQNCSILFPITLHFEHLFMFQLSETKKMNLKY